MVVLCLYIFIDLIIYRCRLNALIDVTYALWNIFRYCIIPPPKPTTAPPAVKSPKGYQSPLLSFHTAGSTMSLNSPMKLPEDRSMTKPHPVTGYEGFQLELYVSNYVLYIRYSNEVCT